MCTQARSQWDRFRQRLGRVHDDRLHDGAGPGRLVVVAPAQDHLAGTGLYKLAFNRCNVTLQSSNADPHLMKYGQKKATEHQKCGNVTRS